MVRFNWRYLSFLGALLVLYLALLYFMPQRFNWFVTLHQHDKNPFGAFILKSLLADSWIPELVSTNETLFELVDLEEQNLMILCENFEISNSEMETILQLVHDGKTVLVSAHQMDTAFTNALNFSMNQLSFSFYLQNMWGEDSTGIKFSNHLLDTSKTYWYPSQLVAQHFSEYDTVKYEVIARKLKGQPVALKTNYGKGSLLLTSAPLAFSNFSMLRSENHEYVAGILSMFVPGKLHWTEYYQLGRMESQTPFRYVLTQPPLKWALYILMIAIVIFMVFDVKRKQRVIPVLAPLKNETMDFVKTIARLYFQKKDHKNLASKKILHFMEYLKHHLHIDLNDDMSEIIGMVASKTSTEESEVKSLFDQIDHVSVASFITSKELSLMVSRINGILRN